MIKELVDAVLTNNYNHIYKIYDSIVGKYNSDENKTWILDVDDKEQLEDIAFYCIDNNIIIMDTIDTINGSHLIVKPFDSRQFKSKYPTIDIHKDNPTLLFADLIK